MSLVLTLVFVWLIMLGSMMLNVDNATLLICVSIIFAGGLAGLDS